MSPRSNFGTPRGYFVIGIWRTKDDLNVGGLWRAAALYGAAGIFTVGRRYRRRQASDTTNTRRHIPLHHYDDLDDLVAHLPHATPLIGVELDPRATMLADYQHPERACYLLGAEDHGLSPAVRDRCHDLVQIETPEPWSMNVASAGSILLRDRHLGQLARRPLAGVS